MGLEKRGFRAKNLYELVTAHCRDACYLADLSGFPLKFSPLAARGESPVTQKMGTATDFRSPSLLETKHFDERKSDGSPHFFTPTHFYHGLLGSCRVQLQDADLGWYEKPNRDDAGA